MSFFGNRPLLAPGLVNSLRKKVGPQIGESQAEIWSLGEEVADGAGTKLLPDFVELRVPARYMYIGMLSQKEREVMGIVAQNGQHLISLPALTEVRKENVIVIIGWQWSADKEYFEGAQLTPAAEFDLVDPDPEKRRVFRAYPTNGSGKARSGLVEPDWPDTLGATVLDGEIMWKLTHYAQTISIVEIMRGTYEITRRVVGIDRE